MAPADVDDAAVAGAAPTAAQRGAQTRERLLAAAVDAVAEVGWGSVTTRLVAERAGVNPGLVHYHFSSVRTLLREAALTAAEGLSDQFVELLRGTDDVDTGLRLTLETLSRYGADDPLSIVIVEAGLAATRDDELRDRLGAVIARFRETLAEWMRDLGHDPNPEAIALIAAAFDGLALHRALLPDFDLAALAPMLASLVDAGAPR